MVQEIVVQAGITKIVEEMLADPLKDIGELARDGDFDGLRAAFAELNLIIPEITENVKTLDAAVDGVSARNRLLVQLGGVKGQGLPAGEAEAEAGRTGGIQVTTISGAFRDVLQQLAQGRDNLLREIRDELRGMRGNMGMGADAAPALGAPGLGGGANIHVENVQVQQVADIAEMDAIVANQFDNVMGRQFAKGNRSKGRRR